MNKRRENTKKLRFALVLVSTIIMLTACTDNTDYTSGELSINANPRNGQNQSFIVKSSDNSFYYQGMDKKITRLNNSNKVVYDDTLGLGIMIHEGYVYYRNEGESAELIRFSADNPLKKEVVSQYRTFNPIIVDDMIYATFFDLDNDKFGLYRMNLDGSKKKKLVGESIVAMQYYDGYIYYSLFDHGKLFRIDLNGNNQEIILWKETDEFIRTLDFIVDNGWIYFKNMNFDGGIDGDGKGIGAVDSSLGICRIRIDGTDYEELISGTLQNIYTNADEEFIIFSDEDTIYKLNIETKEVESIFNIRQNSICVIDNNLFVLHTESETLNSIIYQINMETNTISVVGE